MSKEQLDNHIDTFVVLDDLSVVYLEYTMDKTARAKDVVAEALGIKFLFKATSYNFAVETQEAKEVLSGDEIRIICHKAMPKKMAKDAVAEYIDEMIKEEYGDYEDEL